MQIVHANVVPLEPARYLNAADSLGSVYVRVFRRAAISISISRKISRKLCGPGRDWVGTRYYIGQVNQGYSAQLYADQRSFLARLVATDPKITHHLGRLEPRKVENEAANEIRKYLASLKVKIDKTVFHDLMRLARMHQSIEVMAEKAVDVMLAVDAVLLAERN